ncbi:hypothetical protein BJV82DRAFT_317937 [Fennellomyces sp. T-0311]|nr:hypothetical protein BJV82DRAFT_317937 [Fennellomyces sp. T-0311]
MNQVWLFLFIPIQTSFYRVNTNIPFRFQGRSFIDIEYKKDRSVTDISDRAYRALENIGKRLTYLELGPESGRRYTLSLERILPVCENLTELRCKSSHITSPPSGIWFTNTTVLTRLVLSAEKISLSTLEPVLRHSPQLEEFIVDGCEDDVTTIFEYSCPRLTLLAINSDSEIFFSNNPPRDRSGNGWLRHVFISRTPSSRSLFSLLNRNASVLETLQIYYSDGTPEGWRPISTFTAPNLKNLELYLSDVAIRHHLVDILKSNTHIQRLELQGLDDEGIGFEATENSNTDSLLSAIVDMHNLRELYLARFTTEGEWLNRLFEHYAAQGQSALITRLIVSNCGCSEWSATLDFSFSVTKMTSLTHLGMVGEIYYEYLSESNIVDLARRIGRMPQLSVLAVRVKKFSIDAARCIITSTSLKRIYFQVITHWSTRTLEDIVDGETMCLLQNHGIQVAKTNLEYFYFESLSKE